MSDSAAGAPRVVCGSYTVEAATEELRSLRLMRERRVRTLARLPASERAAARNGS